MSTLLEIKEAIEKTASTFEDYKKVNDDRIEALTKGNTSAAAELDAQLKKIEASISESEKKRAKLEADREVDYKLQQERIEILEARASGPGADRKSADAAEYEKAWEQWIRAKGMSPTLEEKLEKLQKKDVTIGTGSAGGFAVPEVIARQIGLLEQKYSPVRRIVRVVQAGSSDYKELIDLNNQSAGWVGESGSRTATLTPSLRERAPTHGELYAYPQASEWSLDDIFFNVEAWITDAVARAFAINEGAAVISGDGSNKPTGMLDTAPVATPDFNSPLRAAAAYEFVACLSVESPLVATIYADCLIDAFYKLNSAYRANATWVMNSLTTGSVRKLKDTTGQYLWQPSLQAGQPAILLGRPVETWEQMEDIGTNNHPIAIGDFRQGYLLADRVGLRITRDNVTNVGFVRFYVRRREGGCVLNNDAIKFIKTTIA